LDALRGPRRFLAPDAGLERQGILVLLDDHRAAADGTFHPLPRLLLLRDEDLAAAADQLERARRDADRAALRRDAGQDLGARLGGGGRGGLDAGGGGGRATLAAAR